MSEKSLVTIKYPKSPVAEAYRTLRTNIQFSSFDNRVQTIVITSSGPGEGKSTTAANLAVSTAQGGNRTILIDCDLRNPKLHKMFVLSNETGLSDMLIGSTNHNEAIQKTNIDNLYILTSGTKPPNPSELLASEKMRSFIADIKNLYDYIIIDTPPVIMVTDAQILSKFADGSILVVASGEAEKEAALRAKELLLKVDAKMLGVVLNKLDTSRKGYYGHYHYYYDSDEKHGKNAKKGLFGKNKSKRKISNAQ